MIERRGGSDRWTTLSLREGPQGLLAEMRFPGEPETYALMSDDGKGTLGFSRRHVQEAPRTP